MRVTQSLEQTQFLAAINSLESGINQTQSQMSSGLQFTTASQNPTAAGSVNNYEQALAQSQQYGTNATSAQTNLNTEDNALTQVQSQLQSLRSLALEANSGILTNSNLSAIATQAVQIQNSLLSLANTTNGNGEYIFGGFAAGLLFHRHRDFVEAWRNQVGQFVLVFFLPVFFTYTGLRTNVLGLVSLSDWTWCSVIFAAAVLGKIVPVYAAARLSGFGRDESAVMGALMNTRALMELIVLNIGFDLGLIPNKVFTMLVIMAVLTTLMAGPLLKRLLANSGYPIPVGVEA